MPYTEEVNGKVVVANSPEELAEGVAAVKAEKAPVAPDINNPADGNKIVSPDNPHTEPIPSEVSNEVADTPVEESPVDETPKAPAKATGKKK